MLKIWNQTERLTNQGEKQKGITKSYTLVFLRNVGGSSQEMQLLCVL